MQIKKAPQPDWIEMKEQLMPFIHQTNITKLAEKAGLSRVHLHRVLSDRGNPEFDTLTRIVKACGLKLVIVDN